MDEFRQLGKLYSVATPIGNLGDMTYRAVETLRRVHLILCEDTRVSKRLLDRYRISTPTRSYHQFTKPTVVREYLGIMMSGHDLAIITDAGTPGISDPGGRLIQAAILEGVTVVPIPGASALVVALQSSGVDTNTFVFYGFLPHKRHRQRLLNEIIAERRTVILYESPHRLLKTLAVLKESNKYIVVARELTKVYEEFIRGKAADVYAQLQQRGTIKGECVLIIAPHP